MAICMENDSLENVTVYLNAYNVSGERKPRREHVIELWNNLKTIMTVSGVAEVVERIMFDAKQLARDRKVIFRMTRSAFSKKFEPKPPFKHKPNPKPPPKSISKPATATTTATNTTTKKSAIKPITAKSPNQNETNAGILTSTASPARCNN